MGVFDCECHHYLCDNKLDGTSLRAEKDIYGEVIDTEIIGSRVEQCSIKKECAKKIGNLTIRKSFIEIPDFQTV